MSQSLPLGTTLLNGKYHIRKVLGRGSFGITYLAETKSVLHGSLGTLEFGVTVAIKEFFLRDINQRDTITAKVEGSTGELFASYQRKFRKEALNLTKLTHSGIIKVLDVFDENGTTYYAMEFVEGQTLDDYILEHGALPEDEAIDILVEIGNALQYMHSQKMLHLDIKPKNIMRSLDGKHRLIDFGLSKTFGGDGESESSSNIGLGTPGYASLEQATYKQDGSFPATLDIYSLGATFFKMLTGHRPPEPTEILNHGFPEDDLKECGVCGRTISIISKAMALAKVARYQSVQEFISDLTSPLSESETTSSPLDVITPEEITIISPQSENPKPETSKSDIDETEVRETEVENEDFDEKIGVTDEEIKNNSLLKRILAILFVILLGVGLLTYSFWIPDTASIDDPNSTVGKNAQAEDKISNDVEYVESPLEERHVENVMWRSKLGTARYSGHAIIEEGVEIPHGQGTAIFIDGESKGDEYKGNFVEGNISGKGFYRMLDGSTFNGLFKDNKFTQGKFVDGISGTYFVGTFTNGEPDKGQWYDKDGKLF